MQKFINLQQILPLTCLCKAHSLCQVHIAERMSFYEVYTSLHHKTKCTF